MCESGTTLDVCDKWNLSIRAVKSSWGCQKVDYHGHRVSAKGLEAHPKDLQSLVDLPLPTTLKAMQSVPRRLRDLCIDIVRAEGIGLSRITTPNEWDRGHTGR